MCRQFAIPVTSKEFADMTSNRIMRLMTAVALVAVIIARVT